MLCQTVNVVIVRCCSNSRVDNLLYFSPSICNADVLVFTQQGA